MTKLSVNINKIATLRNARGGNTPSVLQAAIDVQKFGAEGKNTVLEIFNWDKLADEFIKTVSKK